MTTGVDRMTPGPEGAAPFPGPLHGLWRGRARPPRGMSWLRLEVQLVLRRLTTSPVAVTYRLPGGDDAR